MQRTKWRELKLPDAINRSKEKEGFTQVSNLFIRDPKISAEAKTILVMLLSNKEGWISHKTTLKTMMKEGRDSIQKGLAELKELGYLTHIGFRDKITKEFKGSFWAYTDVANDFVYHKNVKILENKGFEIIVRKPAILPRNTESPLYGKSTTNNTIIKNKTKRTEISDEISSINNVKPSWRYLNRDVARNCKYDNDIRYVKCTDGYYRHGISGAIYIP